MPFNLILILIFIQLQSACQIKTLRIDRGGEFIYKPFLDYCKENGIQRQLTARHTPQQNGVVERKNRVIEEMAKSMLKGKRLPNKFWVEAWYKQKHDVNHLKVFGSIAYALIPSQSIDKFDKKGERLIFIGYSDESKGFQLFNLRKDQLLLSRDVIFLNLQLGNGKIQSIQNQQHLSYLKFQSSLMFPILLLKIKLVQILRMMEAHQVLMKN